MKKGWHKESKRHREAYYKSKVNNPKRVNEKYNGWANWDTWATMLVLENDERTYKWLVSWSENFKKKKRKGVFSYEKAGIVVDKYIIPVARGRKKWITKHKMYPGQLDFVGEPDINPKKVDKREIIDAILEQTD